MINIFAKRAKVAKDYSPFYYAYVKIERVEPGRTHKLYNRLAKFYILSLEPTK